MSIYESRKTEVLMSMLENILDNDEKAIIFTQYVRMGEILKELIENHLMKRRYSSTDHCPVSKGKR